MKGCPRGRAPPRLNHNEAKMDISPQGEVHGRVTTPTSCPMLTFKFVVVGSLMTKENLLVKEKSLRLPSEGQQLAEHRRLSALAQA